VQQRVGEVHGGQLASALTLGLFTALFPLVLGVAAIFGFLSHSQPELADHVIRRLGLTGSAATTMHDAFASAERTRAAATVLGVAGLVWAGLAVVAGLEAVFDAVWQVGGRGWRSRLVDLAWLVGAVVILAGSAALTAILRVLPHQLGAVSLVAAFAVNVVLWLWTFATLTNRSLPWRSHLPGAIFGAVGLQALTAIGALYVPRAVSSASAVYGTLGVVLAVLAWLLFFGRLVVYAAVLDVIVWEDRHGTVTVDVEVPRVPGDVPLNATRAGGQVA
jgi:membrane protein